MGSRRLLRWDTVQGTRINVVEFNAELMRTTRRGEVVPLVQTDLHQLGTIGGVTKLARASTAKRLAALEQQLSRFRR
jgi:hypothetical protein